MNQLERDYNHCHNIMKEHSKTFSYAFDFLDLKRKKAIWAIYAVCRIIDDSIDKYKDLEQLNGIARDLDVIYSDCDYIQAYQSDAAIMNALSNTLNTYSIPKKPFESLIQYVKEDLVLKEMKTDSDLYEYCYGVAGTVGELLTPILTSSNENNFEQAEEAAIAYHEILVEVRKANYTLHKKVYVSKLKKMKIYRELSAKYNRSETL
ncbi:phytoene/squalene synthase family protein [Staphylococcus cohnii]|uniref:phytoene/squalene synthase family protein n=1 Tax=Staphylococcus cohnii TaxID=29382 RepID=UPI003AF529D5